MPWHLPRRPAMRCARTAPETGTDGRYRPWRCGDGGEGGEGRASLSEGGREQLHARRSKSAMHLRKIGRRVDVPARLVAADLLDTREAERVAGVVPGGFRDGVERHLEHDFGL